MSKYKLASLGLIALAVLTALIWVSLEKWPFEHKPPPAPETMPACRWPLKSEFQENNTCVFRCPEVYASSTPVQSTSDGITYLYCCPLGYTTNIEVDDGICEKPP